MKKRRIAALVLLAPLALLTACGERSSLVLSANWYANTGSKQITDTYEELEYKVTFDAETGKYSVDYDEGVYKTTLSVAQNYSVGNETMDVYHYHTDFEITGRFTYNGVQGTEFTDTAESDVWFLSVGDALRPLKSTRKVHYHLPVGTPSASAFAGDFYEDSEYEYTTEYDNALEKAEYTLQIKGKEPVNKTIKLSGSGTYLDNEQIAFALRGLDMSAAVYFRSIDPQTMSTVEIKTERPTTSTSYEEPFERVGGETVTKLDTVVNVTLKYNTAQPGPDRKLVYAPKTSADNNIYRNVLLKISSPIMYSLGTMVYTLKKATFTTR